MRRVNLVLALGLLVLAACARDDTPDLMTFGANIDGPDEFAILPTKPLETPPDLASLPEPVPGGTNLADPQPRVEAVAALGGNAAVLTRGATDGALVSYAGRFGTQPGIRTELADADLAFRQRNRGRLLERLFRVNRYFGAYETQSLDQHRELERFRAAGIRTPSAPPEASEE